VSQQGQIAPSSPAVAAPTPPPKPTQPPASSLWSRLAIPLFAVMVALGVVALITRAPPGPFTPAPFGFAKMLLRKCGVKVA
jgi:hypothetical protein